MKIDHTSFKSENYFNYNLRWQFRDQPKIDLTSGLTLHPWTIKAGTTVTYYCVLFIFKSSHIFHSDVKTKFLFQYDRFYSRLTQVQTTCDKYGLGKGTTSLPPDDYYEVC